MPPHATPRIALIHALAHSVAPINDTLAREWPEAQRMNLLDDSLSADVARSGRLDDAMTARFLALGDYAAGPSHALPSGGTSTWASALGTHDFLARTNYIHFTRDALRDLGPHVERLARLEGFGNHAASVTTRVG